MSYSIEYKCQENNIYPISSNAVQKISVYIINGHFINKFSYSLCRYRIREEKLKSLCRST